MEEIFHTRGCPRLRRKHALSNRACKKLVGQISLRGIVLSPRGVLDLCRDLDDNYLIEMALLGHADFLVTEDADLLEDPAIVRFLGERGDRAVRIAEFVKVLSESAA